MKFLSRRQALIALASAGSAVAAASLSACGSDDADTIASDSSGVTELNVGATPTPQGEILKFVGENLAAAANLKITVTEYTDYQIPNQALTDGDIDANYFQHIPFLEDQIKEKDFDLAHFEGIHIEPLGIYAGSIDSLDALPDGAEIGIPNDPTNLGRALKLLADNGVITLQDGVDAVSATVDTVAENPKNVTFTQLDAAQIPRSLDDFAAGVVNGNYALEAGLKPSEDAIVLESGDDNPYANILAVRSADKENAAILKLDELLHSDEVRDFIETTYTDGSVLPAF